MHRRRTLVARRTHSGLKVATATTLYKLAPRNFKRLLDISKMCPPAVCIMKAYTESGGMEPLILISAPYGSEWSGSRPAHITPGDTAPGTQWNEGWLGTHTALALGKENISFDPAAIWTPNRAAGSQVTVLTTLSRLLWCMWKKFYFCRSILHPIAPPALHARTAHTAAPVHTGQTPKRQRPTHWLEEEGSFPLQLIFTSYPLIKTGIRDLEMFQLG